VGQTLQLLEFNRHLLTYLTIY